MFTLPLFPLFRPPVTLIAPFLIYGAWRWLLPRLKMRDPARRCRLLWMLALLPLMHVVFVGVRPNHGVANVLVGVGPLQPAALRRHLFRERGPAPPLLPQNAASRWLLRRGLLPEEAAGRPFFKGAPSPSLFPAPPLPIFFLFATMMMLHFAGVGQAVLLGVAEYLHAARRIARLPKRRENDVWILETSGSAAFTFGLIRPQIFVSAAVWDSPHRAAVLAHERAHRLRRDPLIRLVTRSARRLFWFLPFWQRWTAQIEFEAERACDEIACRTVGRPAYAEALLAFLDAHPGTAAPRSGLLAHFASAEDAKPIETGMLARARALCESEMDETPRLFWPIFFVLYAAVAILF